MCCFSGRVAHVANTQIFARHGKQRRSQFLVYDMQYAAEKPVAMILPLPVSAGSGEHAVRFVDLKEFPYFFGALDSRFPRILSHGLRDEMPQYTRRSILDVVQVGDFVASYVPGVEEFQRLDPRFRLPRQVWNRLPNYRDYGFAVFQLISARGSADTTPKQPMAFEFATRHADALYFPTVHIHDGNVHPEEEFDHQLYYQGRALGDVVPFPGGVQASHVLGPGFPAPKAQGIVDDTLCCYRGSLKGRLPNRDTFVRLV